MHIRAPSKGRGEGPRPLCPGGQAPLRLHAAWSSMEPCDGWPGATSGRPIDTRDGAMYVEPTGYETLRLRSGVCMTTDQLSAVFGALADPTRRAILARLTEGDATVAELAAPFSVSQPAISKHLKVLEQAGLISRQRRRPAPVAPLPRHLPHRVRRRHRGALRRDPLALRSLISRRGSRSSWTAGLAQCPLPRCDPAGGHAAASRRSRSTHQGDSRRPRSAAASPAMPR